jgi:hypothetical protein
MSFSEQRLNLPVKWYTGKEWADGTAEAESIAEYDLACGREHKIEDAKTPAQKAKELRERKARRWRNYVAYRDSL